MQLFLYQEVMLLAISNEKGIICTSFAEHAVAGAVIAELLLSGHIKVTNDKKPLVEVISRKPLGDPIIDEALKLLYEGKRKSPIPTWLSRLARMKNLKHRVAQGLSAKGILKATEDKVLFIFTRKIYPELDPHPEQEILKRIGSAIFGTGRDLDARTTILISLASGTGLLEANFDRKKVKAQKKRIDAIIQGEAIGKATKELIQSIQTAIMVATVMPIIITT